MTLLRLEAHVDAAGADAATQLLLDAPHAINVSRHRGALLDPPGDLIACDVPRESADDLLERLHALGACSGESGVTITTGLSHVSERANRAERDARGSASDALIWRMLRDTLDEEVELSATYVLFMVLATMLGAIGVITNSAILVVGAMVIGPEFGPLANLCLAFIDRDWRLTAKSIFVLVTGFAIAIVAASLLTLGLDAIGVFPEVVELTGLVKEVASPTWLSLIIAIIAGVAGMLALTSARNGSLMGVLISVTTIPAAADAAVLLVYGQERDAVLAMVTLAINLTGMAVAGVTTLVAHRAIMRRTRTSTEAGVRA